MTLEALDTKANLFLQCKLLPFIWASLVAGKESACSVGDLGLIPVLGRFPGGGKGYPLQYSGLDNSMDCIVHGVAKSQTQQSDFQQSLGQKGLFAPEYVLYHSPSDGQSKRQHEILPESHCSEKNCSEPCSCGWRSCGVCLIYSKNET